MEPIDHFATGFYTTIQPNILCLWCGQYFSNPKFKTNHNKFTVQKMYGEIVSIENKRSKAKQIKQIVKT